MFTIEVKKREKDEEFSFGDALKSAQVVHDDCYGGKGEFKWVSGEDHDYWYFYCKRCLVETQIRGQREEVRLKIIQTAIDGKERKLSDDVRVIQKV